MYWNKSFYLDTEKDDQTYFRKSPASNGRRMMIWKIRWTRVLRTKLIKRILRQRRNNQLYMNLKKKTIEAETKCVLMKT
jgi:hypothetical protein